MKLLLLHDVGPVRRVLDLLAARDAGALEIHSADDVASAEDVLAHQPDLRFVLVGLGGDAPGALAEIKLLNAMVSAAAFIAVMGDSGRGAVIGAINAGACAFIDTNADTDALTDAVRAALAGTIQLPPTILERRGSDRPGFGMWTPTPRSPEALGFAAADADVLRLLLQGKSKPVIAQLLERSEVDVERELAAVLKQLNADGRTQAVLSAARSGLRFERELRQSQLTP